MDSLRCVTFTTIKDDNEEGDPIKNFLNENNLFFAPERVLLDSIKPIPGVASCPIIHNNNLSLTKDNIAHACHYEKFVSLNEAYRWILSATCPCGAYFESDLISGKSDRDNYDSKGIYHRTQDPEEFFQYSDYITQPMIWCDSCNCRSFICIDCKPEVTLGIQVIKDEDHDGNYIDRDVETLTYKYPLMTVERVLNTQLYSWKWTSELFKIHIDKFLAIRQNRTSYYDVNLKSEESFAKEIGLEEEKDNETSIPYDSPVWECSAECNSFDTAHVKLPLDMAHDGIVIYCRLRCDRCGIKTTGSYWGD